MTRFIANSSLCQERIRAFWDRDAEIVHPPVEVERFSPGEAEDFFLIVSEVVPHKRVAVALEAARRAGRRVVVVGEGRDLPRLRHRYEGVHEFRGRLADAELADLYRRALALIVPNVEEFGIAAVEAQASGRPVVGIDAGGLTETVIPGETGELVPDGDEDALSEVLAGTDFGRYDSVAIRRNAERFSTAAFQRGIVAQVDAALGVPNAEAPAARA